MNESIRDGSYQQQYEQQNGYPSFRNIRPIEVREFVMQASGLSSMLQHRKTINNPSSIGIIGSSSEYDSSSCALHNSISNAKVSQQDEDEFIFDLAEQEKRKRNNIRATTMPYLSKVISSPIYFLETYIPYGSRAVKLFTQLPIPIQRLAIILWLFWKVMILAYLLQTFLFPSSIKWVKIPNMHHHSHGNRVIGRVVTSNNLINKGDGGSPAGTAMNYGSISRRSELLFGDKGLVRNPNNNSSSSSSMQYDQLPPHYSNNRHYSRRAKVKEKTHESASPSEFRILHIVTSSTEYDNDQRGMEKKVDRFFGMLIPTLQSSVISLLLANTELDNNIEWHVDVYLILSYTPSQERKQVLQDALPSNVKITYWEDATPYNYNRNGPHVKNTQNKLTSNNLARQHRFVLRDLLYEYDFFCFMQDDMRVTKHHVINYLEVSNRINQWKDKASDKSIMNNDKFYGSLSKQQLERLVPGFIRVEVTPIADKQSYQVYPMPINLNFTTTTTATILNLEATSKNTPRIIKTSIVHNSQKRTVDVDICCAIPDSDTSQWSNNIAVVERNPTSDQLLILESGIKAFGVHHFPPSSSSSTKTTTKLTSNYQSTSSTKEINADWMGIMPGPKFVKPHEKIGEYWSGTSQVLGNDKDPTVEWPKPFANSGGYMGSRSQILHFDEMCRKQNTAFLPPFSGGSMETVHSNNVEFWNGGYQLFSGVEGGCNLQRVLPLDVDGFSRSLLHRVSNNKQHTIVKGSLIQADTLLGQLNHLVKEASSVMEQEQNLSLKDGRVGRIKSTAKTSKRNTNKRKKVII